jgi:hypothetical protein
MVTNDRSYEEQTRKRLSEAKAQAQDLWKKIEEMQTQHNVLSRQITAYTTILEGYGDNREEDWATLLKELSHKDKLISIAKHNGGQLGHAEATDIIFSNNLTSAKTRAIVYQMVKNTLDSLIKDGIFVKSEPGKYQLVESQTKLQKEEDSKSGNA